MAELAAIDARDHRAQLTGLIVGWRIDTDVAHALGGFGLLLLFALAMIWLGTLLGVIVRSPDAVQGIAFMTVFPLTFVSTHSCRSPGCPTGCARSPSGTRSVRSPPRCGSCSATRPRHLPTRRGRSQHPVPASLLWIAVILALSVPLCLARFRAKTTD